MIVRCLIAAVLLGNAGWVGAAGPDELDQWVGQWLALRTELAQERLAWEEQERFLRSELDLLQTEHAKLQAEWDAFEAESTSDEVAIAQEIARRSALESAVNDLLPVIRRTESALRHEALGIPAALNGDVERLVHALPTSEAAARRLAMGERLQRAIALLAWIESLQQEIHVTQEIIVTDEGSQRFVDAVYLGLARGYAVSPDGDWAAVGVPGPDGWTWTSRADIAPAVRDAVLIGKRQQVAAFVTLPLQIDDSEVQP